MLFDDVIIGLRRNKNCIRCLHSVDMHARSNRVGYSMLEEGSKSSSSSFEFEFELARTFL